MSGVFPLRLTDLIHDRFSIVMNFAAARRPLEHLSERFEGDWRYLGESLFGRPERRATEACLELALFMRLLFDDEGEGAGSSSEKGAGTAARGVAQGFGTGVGPEPEGCMQQDHPREEAWMEILR